jgi:hypothetical protein
MIARIFTLSLSLLNESFDLRKNLTTGSECAKIVASFGSSHLNLASVFLVDLFGFLIPLLVDLIFVL